MDLDNARAEPIIAEPFGLVENSIMGELELNKNDVRTWKCLPILV